MAFIAGFIDLFIHLDKHLGLIIQTYGTTTYLILFLIIFLETGIVATPFLPGDSLLFAAGTFAALGTLNVVHLWALLSLAAILGDTANYWIGRYVGERVFKEHVRFIKKKHLDRTQEFYAKYGGKTIVIARFVPIIRTFAPFVAGVGRMSYGRFIAYNIIGGLAWTTLFILGGYYFGNMEIVKRNFSLVILAIIALSLMPIIFELLRNRSSRTQPPSAA